MRTVYVESSALLAWLLKEPTRDTVSGALARPARLCSSALTRVEAGRAVSRAMAVGTWSVPEAAALLSVLDDFMKEWVLSEVHPHIRRRAARSFPTEPIRTLDAVHLATALELLPAYPDLSVLTLDRRILANLEPLGLRSAL